MSPCMALKLWVKKLEQSSQSGHPHKFELKLQQLNQVNQSATELGSQ